MEIQVETEFALKMTIIDETIAKNVILHQMSTFSGTNFVQNSQI